MESETDIKYEAEFVLNSRKMKLLTSRWLPVNGEPKALIFICHGYAMECCITMSSTATRLEKAGFAVYGEDYEGHGKSDGLPGLVSNFDHVIDDCSNHFTTICEEQENKKMRYLLGESMGGAVVLLLHRKMPEYWDGAILVAPMCKIADEMRRNAAVISVLTALSKIIPTWKMIPTQDIIDVSFKVPEVREQVRTNPYCHKGRPRLKTGYELLRVSSEIEQRLHERAMFLALDDASSACCKICEQFLLCLVRFHYLFFVLHGEDDKVIDKSISVQLYDVASSADKTLKLYPGMWHGLLYGEPPENLNIVFSDIINWLEERSLHGNKRIEREHKQQNEDSLKF